MKETEQEQKIARKKTFAKTVSIVAATISCAKKTYGILCSERTE